jgi:hypothetical protein
VVELAWTVLEAGAAAGIFETGGSSSSSSQWEYQFAVVKLFGASLAQALGTAALLDNHLRQWRPHAQQFAFDALEKLLMLTAGMFIRFQYRQRQQQGQVPVQPYHQQLLEELKMQLPVLALRSESAATGASDTLQACAALAFAVDMQRELHRSSSEANGSGSSSSQGSETRTSAQPAPAAAEAAAAAAGAAPLSLGVSSKLHELLLLTMLEFVVLSAANDPSIMVFSLSYSIFVQQYGLLLCSSNTAAAYASVYLQLLQAMRCCSVWC